MSVILIASAAASNFEGMDAMVGQDGLVYLGKRENYPRLLRQFGRFPATGLR